MKKLSFSLAILMACAFTNLEAKTGFSLGLKGGYNSTTYKLTDVKTAIIEGTPVTNFGVPKPEQGAGFQLGGFMRLDFDKLYIQPEMVYSLKRSKTNFDLTAFTVADPANIISQDISSGSIDFPILVGYHIINFKFLKLNAFTGPVASFQTNSNITFRKDGVKTSTSDGENLWPFKDVNSTTGFADKMNKANWNWQVGGGVDVGPIMVDVRYEIGMSDVSQMSFKQKSNMLTFGIGYKF